MLFLLLINALIVSNLSPIGNHSKSQTKATTDIQTLRRIYFKIVAIILFYYLYIHTDVLGKT